MGLFGWGQFLKTELIEIVYEKYDWSPVDVEVNWVVGDSSWLFWE